MDFQKVKKWIKDNKWIILIILLTLLIQIVFVYSSSIKWWDETIYANIGYHLSQNPLDYSLRNTGFGDYIPQGKWYQIGFRAPLLPYALSFFYLLKLDFLIVFFIPLISTISIFLIYLIGKEIFNKKVGLYSSIFLALLPLYVYYSNKILTDTFSLFFILLTVLFFWKGYEKNNNKYKLLFGVFFGLSILSRYSSLWMIPLFVTYILIRDKSLRITKDKYFWYTLISLFIILSPLLIYGYFEYNNPIGPFLHGQKAASYWGGTQSASFFITNFLPRFSIVTLVFIASLLYILIKKDIQKKEIYFNIIWFITIFILATLMPHKEDRLIMPLVPAVCILCGFFISKLKKKYKEMSISLIILILLVSNILILNENIKVNNNINSKCFKETIDYINQQNSSYLLITENPPIYYYYTKQETRYYPNPLKKETIINLSNDKKILFVYNRLNSGLEDDTFIRLKEILKESYKQEFNCSQDPEHNFIYS